MIFRNPFPRKPSPYSHDYGEPAARRPVGLALAVLFHLLVLWMVIQPRMLLQKKAGKGVQESETVWLTPPAQIKPPAKPTPKVLPKPVTPQHQVVHSKPSQASPQQQAPEPPPVVQQLPTITTPPPEDMMAQIEARRKRRSEERKNSSEPEPAPAPEDENQRAIARAQANLANLQARAGNSGREQHGGVFRLGKVSYHRAEYVFNGWNKNFKRQMPTRIEVELGDEKDIETAIVNSMIVLIRKERSAEFTWESHRLGRVVELNARPEYTAELQAFLMKEFFPSHRALARQ